MTITQVQPQRISNVRSVDMGFLCRVDQIPAVAFPLVADAYWQSNSRGAI